MNGEEHILSLLVQNKPGVLSRLAGVFGRLGYNIETLCVAPTLDRNTSRITLMSRADSNFTDKVRKHLDRLVDIIKVEELPAARSLQREILLMGVDFSAGSRADMLKAMELFGCRMIFMKDDYAVLQAVGSPEETETVLRFFQSIGSIREMARTGIIAVAKEKKEDA